MRMCLPEKSSWRGVVVITATAMFTPFSASAVDFADHVQPILREHCFECHGPSQQMNGLRLDRRRDVLPNRVGANGAPVVPGNSAASRLYQRIAGTAAGRQMPPTGPLTAEQISTIKAWIDGGAEWPDELAGGSSPAANPVVTTLGNAIRDDDRKTFARMLRDQPDVVKTRGAGAWTALMYAAAFGRAIDVRELLDKGADPNVQNEEGATALMYATDDLEKTRALLDAGAKPNLRSGEGRTALMIAASGRNSYQVAQLLINRGADAKLRAGRGQSTLQEAALAGDLPLIRLLLDHGADPKGISLGSIRAARCRDCMDLLLPSAKPDDLGVAMVGAAMTGNGALFNALLERGVKAPPAALHFIAISPEPIPKDVITRLIRAGADPKRLQSTLTVRELARRHENTMLLEALTDAGVPEDKPAYTPPAPKPAKSIKAAIERSIPPLQRADVAFLHKAGCVSCHNNSLTAMTLAAAQPRGLRFDEQIAKEQTRRIAAFLDENRERALEGAGLPGGVDTVSYILLGMAAAQYPSDAITDAWAKYVKTQQSPDGMFACITRRPPLESSDFETTAAAVRVLRAYGPKALRAEYEQAAARGIAWLEQAKPNTVEDRSFQILGLMWGSGSKEIIRKSAESLLALQAPDGGWAQRRGAATEAYSTGQALVALRESGTVARTNKAFQKGIEYLRNSQLADGSWYVASRAVPFQPYFDSDFAHGPDQFISAAATNWASMALISALP